MLIDKKTHLHYISLSWNKNYIFTYVSPNGVIDNIAPVPAIS